MGNNPQHSFCEVYPFTINFVLGQMILFGQWDAG